MHDFLSSIVSLVVLVWLVFIGIMAIGIVSIGSFVLLRFLVGLL